MFDTINDGGVFLVTYHYFPLFFFYFRVSLSSLFYVSLGEIQIFDKRSGSIRVIKRDGVFLSTNYLGTLHFINYGLDSSLRLEKGI